MTNKTNESSGRRKLLKTAAASSGMAVVATALPTNWTKPVVDSILLPAHAQTSAVIGGVYTAAAVGITLSPKKMKTGVQYALLDTLISPANAQVVFDGSKPDSHIVRGLCGVDANTDDDGDGDDTIPLSSPATITFRVNANDSVDVAVTADSISDDDTDPNCSGATTIISGTMIQDVTVQLDADEFIALTNMVATATEISGDWSTVFTSDDDDRGDAAFSDCGASFTAPLGGSFPATQLCTDDA